MCRAGKQQSQRLSKQAGCLYLRNLSVDPATASLTLGGCLQEEWQVEWAGKGWWQGLGPSEAPRHRGSLETEPPDPSQGTLKRVLLQSVQVPGVWGNCLRDLGAQDFSFLISLTVQAVAVCATHLVISVCSEIDGPGSDLRSAAGILNLPCLTGTLTRQRGRGR